MRVRFSYGPWPAAAAGARVPRRRGRAAAASIRTGCSFARRMLRRQIAKLRDVGLRARSASASSRDLVAALARRTGTPRSPSTTASSTTSRRSCRLLEDEDAAATVFVVSGWLGEAASGGAVDADRDGATSFASCTPPGSRSAPTRPRTPTSARCPTRRRGPSSRAASASWRTSLGEPVEVAAYPFGRASAETVRACRDAGFRGRLPADARGARGTIPHNLPRQDMRQPLQPARAAAQARQPLRAADAASRQPARRGGSAGA